MRRTLVPLAAAFALACAAESGDTPEPDDQADGKADEAEGETAAPACVQKAVFPSSVLADALMGIPGAIDDTGAPVIGNYTSWPVYDPASPTARMDANVTRRISDPDEALENIASRFGTCMGDMTDHIEETSPNVYIYFTGFGGADQNNSIIEQGAVMRWINERDPNALIFSISWNCAAESDPFCAQNTQAIASTEDSPHVKSMNRAIDVIVPQLPGGEQLAPQLKGAIAGFGQQQAGYDSAMSHSIQLAAKLIDQILVADNGEGRFGDIRIAGYSMGAHSAAQVLVQDFTGTGGGFEWTRDGVCPDGGNVCTVAALDKVKWSLSMGLSGWAHAMEGFDRTDRDQYQNGGLFRVEDRSYRGKLAVLNRRMDPTGNSDDTFQRGFLDIFFGDYNHYSHDYDLPLFIDEGFKRGLDAFLESSSMKSSREIGIVYDNASLVDFDTCPVDGECKAPTGYVAHQINRSHAGLDVPKVTVKTVEGVEHTEKMNNRAASLARGVDPIVLRTFDQEDLRGGVELYLRPHFDPAGEGVHGVFSYGGCKESDEELMPTAFFEDGVLVFQMLYEGEPFRVEVDAAEAGIRQDEWTHLAFTWELPVESLTVQHDNANDLIAQLPGMLPDIQQHQVALVLATGLTKPLATTYKRQEGEGTMRIYVNGEPVEAALGTPESTRECLMAEDVLSNAPYNVNGEMFPPFVPYARYTPESGDIVAFSPEQVLGTKCKAYRIRNEQAFFGCAQSDEVNADADMDDITLVWGPGRTEYENVDHETGEPVTWPLGVDYDATPLRL